MASIVFPLGWRLTDSNGNPVNNGKIYVYDAGTSNESSVYSDKALSTALTQPIRTNSGGVPITAGDAETLIYVATGADYKIEAKTSADAQIFGPIDDYPILGRNSGTVAVADGGTGATTAATARTNLGAAAQSDYTTLSSTVTTISGERTALPGGAFNDLAGLDLLTPSYLNDFGPVCVQSSYNQNTANTALSTMAATGSLPTTSDGTEIFSVSFTPRFSGSVIDIWLNVSAENQSGASASDFTVAVFQDTTCIQARAVNVGISATTIVPLFIRVNADSTTARTFSVRAGGVSTTFNMNDVLSTGDITTLLIEERLASGY